LRRQFMRLAMETSDDPKASSELRVLADFLFRNTTAIQKGSHVYR
jgi:hypothetical protein